MRRPRGRASQKSTLRVEGASLVSGSPGRVSALMRSTHVPPRSRVVLSIALGCLAAAMCFRGSGVVGKPSDFGQIWFAARAILDGSNPYTLIGPGLVFDWPWSLLYPLPAAFVAVPLAYFSEPIASALFVGVGGGLFAWSLMEYGYGPLFGFFSLGVREAAGAGQWSLLIAAAFVVSPIGLVLVAKPTVGLAMFFARPTRWALAGCVLMVATAFAVQPTWITDWRDAMAANTARWPASPYRAIISFPGGVLALLCLARWRRPEARLVAALVCVPITVSAYETVPLLMVPRTFWQAALLVLLSYVQQSLKMALLAPPWSAAQFVAATGQLLVVALYLPATIMVLRRPNEGPLPAWLERHARRLPCWFRGVPIA